MSDGHTDSRRWIREPSVKDAAGRDCFIDDYVWLAADDSSLFEAAIIDVDQIEGRIDLLTKSNSMVEVFFKPKSKNGVPTCNSIIKS